MNSSLLLAAVLSLTAVSAWAAEPPAKAPASADRPALPAPPLFTPESVASEGSVTVEGVRTDYRAIAGTLIVHPKNWDDAAHPDPGARDQEKDPKAGGGAEASMFYVAYFKKGVPAGERPITFLYNGGPGSSTMWLHMGAFGPRRVITKDGAHTDAAPYRLVDNAYSLLDASDLVFIDAPGAGFSRIAGSGQGEGVLGRRPGRPRLRTVHHQLP